MRISGLILACTFLAAPAFGDQCSEPETPDFDVDVEALSVEAFGALTETLSVYEAASADYRACLNEIISSREDGWLDALSAFNASATGQDDVFQAYNAVATEFSNQTEARAEVLAAEQRMASEAEVIAQIEAENEQTRVRAELAAAEQNAALDEESETAAN